MPTTIDLPAAPAVHETALDLQAANKDRLTMTTGTAPRIIDIRRSLVEVSLKEEIMSMLNPARGPRTLPTLLLYNEEGLQIFEEVCQFQTCRHV
jgi:hypothetical protein